VASSTESLVRQAVESGGGEGLGKNRGWCARYHVRRVRSHRYPRPYHTVVLDREEFAGRYVMNQAPSDGWLILSKMLPMMVL